MAKNNNNNNKSYDVEAIRKKSPIVDIIDRYVPLKKDGTEHKACCPFHTEKTPSFTVSSSSGKDFFHCFGCGAHGDVFDFVMEYERVDFAGACEILGGDQLPGDGSGKRKRRSRKKPVDIYAGIEPILVNGQTHHLKPGVKTPELFNPKRADDPLKRITHYTPSMVFPYKNANGGLIGYVLRVDFGDGKKITPTVQYCQLPDGTKQWAHRPFVEPRPLYRLDHLYKHPDKAVLLLEGEKACDAAQRLVGDTYVCTAWPQGTNGRHALDWAPLAGRRVLVWLDMDQPGMDATLGVTNKGGEHKPGVCQYLVQAGAEDVHYIALDSTKTKGWDAADAEDESWTRKQLFDWLGSFKRAYVAQDDDTPPIDAYADDPGANPVPPGDGDVIDAGRDLSLGALLRDFVILHGKGGGVFDDRRCELMTRSDLTNSVGDETAKKFFNHVERRVILRKNLVFEPDKLNQPPGKINLFRGLPLEPKEGDCRRLLDHLLMLCEGSEDVRDWLLKWVAYPLQNIGAKMRTAVVIHGKEGAGKNSFWTAIQRIYGEYSTIITQTDLESSFNAWASRKLFVIGNEVVSRKEMFHQAGVIRNMITEPEWNINDKNISVREEKNFANFVFLSNALQPAAPNEDDRRFLVLWTPPKKEKSYYTALAHERDNGGTEALYHYLLNVQLGEFDEYSEPPMTKAKRDLITLSMKSYEQFTTMWLDGDLPIPLAPAAAMDLYKFYEGWCKRTNQKIMANMTEFGVYLGKHEFLARKRDQEYRKGMGTKKATFIFPAGSHPPEGETKADWLQKCREAFWAAIKQAEDDDI